MNNPKIFVLHIRQVIKASAIVIIGIIALLGIMYYFTRDENSVAMGQYNQQVFVPGTYRSRIYLSYRPAYIAVTVTEEEIVSIVLEPLTQNQQLFYPLLAPTMANVSQEILYNQHLNVSTSDENLFTSKVLVSAVHRALDEAISY